MRLMLTTDAVGGVWRYSLDLAAGLARRGIGCDLAVLGPALSAGQRVEATQTGVLRVIETGLPLDWTAPDPGALRVAAESLAGLAQRLGADRVHLHTPALAAEAPWSVPVVAVAHSCVGTWWNAVRSGPIPADLAWRAQAMARGLAEADAVIAPTRAFATQLTRLYRPGREIQVVHNGAEPWAADDGARTPGVLAAGRLWDEGKNIAALDRVARELDVPVRAAGPRVGPTGAQFEAASLLLLGQLSQTQMRACLAGSTVFASPARYEPFGLAVLEAALGGMALALADIPTFRELWDGAALFFHPDDDAGLRDVLRRLLERPKPFAARARERARLYPLDRMVDATLRVHDGLRDARGRLTVRIVIFAHSLVSCWNHGNAHFLRGVVRALLARGHEVRCLEPDRGWSRANLLADHGHAPLDAFAAAFPGHSSETYATCAAAADAAGEADLVLVHEWNDPALVAELGRRRARGARFRLLFHDTHHRAVSDPQAIRSFDLSGYDAVLAFGAALADVYRRWGWGARVHVWHEAADTALFRPPEVEATRDGLVWIGNWGDGERTEELTEYLFAPARDCGLALDVYGVRYPETARETLRAFGARYHGWLPNAAAPAAFARHSATVHVPRRFYTTMLPGIPTIRVFEALACGIPLVSAPWDDCEGLFRADRDFLRARDGAAMRARLTALRHDAGLRAAVVASGLETIRARHTCAHRVDELLAIYAAMRQPEPSGAG